jgi:16S rRNA (adenine(1408)-N(1))-methyltransferase
MAEVSRRASRSAARGGLPNALFVVAAAERLPAELHGVADELTIAFPWGSLLRGVLALDDDAAAGIAALLAPDAAATATLSVEARDGLDLPPLDAEGAPEALRERWSRLGLRPCDLRKATAEELALMPSTWARRLAAGRDRSAWRLELRGIEPCGPARGPSDERIGQGGRDRAAPSPVGPVGGPSDERIGQGALRRAAPSPAGPAGGPGAVRNPPSDAHRSPR